MERRRQTRRVIGELVRCVVQRRLPVYSAALAFQTLVAAVPMTLLALAVLGEAGLEDVWRDTLAPSVAEKVTRPVFDGINYSVERIFSSESAGLIALAFGLVLWYFTVAVRLVMDALNAIHAVREGRSFLRQAATAVWLALSIVCLLVAAGLAVTAGPRLRDGGALDWLLTIMRWPLAALLLAVAVALLFHYAPAERPQVRWASAGSALVIAVWLGTSLLFRWYVTSIANFKTAAGNLTVLLVMTAYTFTSSAIFLVGAQLDEILRAESDAKEN
ncbi:MAG: YihY/virulence factor BrkB family protein [Thermoleophilia bacterium]|nr:YihY/virulence factor BrkB family protein [Thermoleophilia bacterium]MDQ3859495.1 YihY/virulence factor BrkB family protein [Actinomycetota bacterium]